jgi:hypothetical protein
VDAFGDEGLIQDEIKTNGDDEVTEQDQFYRNGIDLEIK